MKGEILDIKTVQEIAKLRERNSYLEKINNIFEQIEEYLPKRKEIIQSIKLTNSEIAILELQKLEDAIAYEKKKLLNKEVEEDE